MIALCAPAYALGTSGIGVRVWELAQALAAWLDVAVIARAPAGFAWPRVQLCDAADERTCRQVLDAADAAVFYDLPDTRELLRLHARGTVLVCENAVPIEHLEYHAIRAGQAPDAAHRDLVARYELQVLLSDHFLIQSDVARATLIASLCHVGRLTRRNYDESPSLEHLFSWLPLGFSEAARQHAERSPVGRAVDFVWSGGLWDYYDPVALVRAVERLADAGRPVSLRFLYPAPTDQVLREARRVRELLADGHLERHVEWPQQAPAHFERDALLSSARAAVCLARPGIENATCVRLRLRDTLLYRLPLLVDPFGATATEVRALGLGLVADPRDPAALAQALDALAHDDALHGRLVARIDALRRDYVLDAHVAPLVEVVRQRRHAPDIGSASHRRLVEALLARHPELSSAPSQPW